eukprot:Gb_12692 [translate_table: standard]
MGSQFSKKLEEKAPDVPEGKSKYSVELSAYEEACKADPDVRSFDDALQARTGRVIHALANGVEVRSLSLESFKEVTSALLEMDQEVVKVILDCKSDIWGNPDLFNLVEEYFENSIQTLDFCAMLEKCLKRARDNQLIIQVALQQIPTDGGQPSEEQYKKMLEEMSNFRTAGSPFTEDFFEHFQSVYRRHSQMLEKLQERSSKLDKKLKSVRAWRKVTNVIFAATFVIVLICCVVAAAMGEPHVADALKAATSIAGPMGKWVNSLWKKYEDVIKGQREVISAMHAGTFVTIKDLDNIRVLVDRLEMEIVSILSNVDFCMEYQTAVQIGIEEIKRKQESFMNNMEDLGEHVDHCSRDIRLARTVVLQRIIKPPRNKRSSEKYSFELASHYDETKETILI